MSVKFWRKILSMRKESLENLIDFSHNDFEHYLDIQGLNLWYDEKYVLKNINLQIPPRSVFAIIGPSGCGKSTLLKAINRMAELDATAKITGKIIYRGIDINRKEIDGTSVRKYIGMIFQKSTAFPWSIRENVIYRAKNYNFPHSMYNLIIERSLKEANLWEEVKNDLDRPALTLSGGQAQRLCIARELAVKPDLLLMDEPTSAIDPIATQKIENLINELKKKYSIVIVTHNLQQAARLSDYAAFMYLGEIIESGSKKKIFQNPSKQLTRKYIEGDFS